MAAATSHLLTALLPTPVETHFLRACLLRAGGARQSWGAWLAAVGDPARALRSSSAYRRNIALLGAAAERNDFRGSTPLRSVLRAATLRERLRHQGYCEVAARALEVLASRGVTPLVVKGAAAAAMAYDGEHIRHCHDLDLLVRVIDLERGCAALADAGFTADPRRSGPQDRVLRHGSGLPVALHTGLLAMSVPDDVVAALMARAGSVTLGAVTVMAPAPTDLVLHVCAHAATNLQRRTLTWAADTALIAKSHNLDWERLEGLTARIGLAAPIGTLLGYLGERLEVAVPDVVIARLRAAPPPSTPDLEGLLDVTIGGSTRVAVRLLRRSHGLRERLLVLRSLGRTRLTRWLPGAAGRS